MLKIQNMRIFWRKKQKNFIFRKWSTWTPKSIRICFKTHIIIIYFPKGQWTILLCKLSLSSSNPVELLGADSGQRFSPTNDVLIWRSSLNRWVICFCFSWSANISSYFVHPLSVSLLLNLLLSIPQFIFHWWTKHSNKCYPL